MKKVTRSEELAALSEVLDEGILVENGGGPKVRRFAEQFARYIGVPYGIGVPSGTAALAVSLAALQIGIDDEVIVPAFTYIADASTILLRNAIPVLADIDPVTMCIDPADIERKLTPKTKAILLVHINGHPCEMDRIMEIARQHSLAVIEDCCQAHGGTYKGKKLGSFGDLACFSFSKRHILSCGGGGLVVSARQDLIEIASLLTFHGIADWASLWQEDRDYNRLGFNYSMSEFHAALGLLHLAHLDSYVEQNRLLASVYRAELGEIRQLELPPDSEDGLSVYHHFSVKVAADAGFSRSALLAELRKRKVPFMVNLPPLSKVSIVARRSDPALFRSDTYHTNFSVPVAEDVANRVIALFCDWSKEKEEIACYAQQIKLAIDDLLQAKV